MNHHEQNPGNEPMKQTKANEGNTVHDLELIFLLRGFPDYNNLFLQSKT